MKKLMIVGLSMFAAVAANAAMANWKWEASSGYLKNGNGSSSVNITSGATAYLFDATAFSQQSLLTALTDGTYGSLADAFAAKGVSWVEDVPGGESITHYAPTLNVSGEAKFDQSGLFQYGEGGVGKDYTYYMAVVATDMDGYVFISNSTDPFGGSEIAAGTQITQKSMTNGSKLTSDSTTFGGASWYQTAAVPEPTSGLLLLLGVAGLALRRRRA